MENNTMDTSQPVLPYSRFERLGDPLELENPLEFRLLYQGELMSSGNRSTVPNKHAIRQAFHPQLRRLWEVDERLRNLGWNSGKHWTGSPSDATDSLFADGLKAIAQKWSRAGYQFIPLITDNYGPVQCSLDITILRPDEKRFVLRQGDIDGQVKTLFDALRMPANREEAGGAWPTPDETPFYCLLSDDRLITEVHVLADRLLLLPNHREVSANDAFVSVHVKASHGLLA